MTLSHFHPFPDLPLELQREIWQCVLDQEPEPALHIFRREDVEDEYPPTFTGPRNVLPELVDTDTHPLMHVCRESRSMARRQLRFRHVRPDGTCLGACRPFRPDLDALYVSSRDWPVFFSEEGSLFPLDEGGERGPRPQQACLQHLALDARVAGTLAGAQDVGRYLNDSFAGADGLRTVSVCFSEEGWVPRDHVPTGAMRYQLVACGGGTGAAAGEEQAATVWDAPAGEVKRRDMDPWDVARGLVETLVEVMGAWRADGSYELSGGRFWSPFWFRVVPLKIVPRPGRKHSYYYYDTKDAGWAQSILNGVRGLLLSR